MSFMGILVTGTPIIISQDEGTFDYPGLVKDQFVKRSNGYQIQPTRGLDAKQLVQMSQHDLRQLLRRSNNHPILKGLLIVH